LDDGVAQLLAVCRVAELHDDGGPVGVTAIDKRPVDGAVAVGAMGVYGDVQADRRHHGGPDQAVYAYADEEAAYWSAELGRELPPGVFGENLRLLDVDVDGAEFGERWQVGAHVVLEATRPRVPCVRFGRWLGEPSWPRRFTARGRPGVYLRVVQGGEVRAGDEVCVVHRPGHGVSIGGWFSGSDPRDARTLLAYAVDSGWRVPAGFSGYLDRALARA
jgi:MOSC domain-containing protein YiiM